jgi:hypothetical protein
VSFKIWHGMFIILLILSLVNLNEEVWPKYC